MAGEKMHWFKLYGTDYLGDPCVRELSMAERGALVSLWAACCARGGSLPSDMARVSRMSDVPVEDSESLVPRFFRQRKDGEWESPRMVDEWQKSKMKASAGRAGGKSRGQAGASGSASSKTQAGASGSAPSERASKTQASEARVQSPEPERSHPGSVGSEHSETIHSESGVAGVDASLFGSERQTASYASTQGPAHIGDLLHGIFRGRAV